MFVDPDPEQIKAAHRADAQAVELHTGRYCEARDPREQQRELARLVEAAKAADRLSLRVAAGHGLDSGKHGASLARGQPGVLHGSRSYLLQTDDGQVSEAHSISAGLDYPGVGPELSFLRDQERLTVISATDEEALQAFQTLARSEGILCALESAHAIAALPRVRGELLVVNLS